MIDRFVVPIYNLRIDNEYNCSGIIDEMKYNILLKTYNASKINPDYINEEDLKELFKYGGKNSTKNYYEEIIYKFKQKNQEQNKNEYFIGIRNSIAHGKEFLERDEMKVKVLELYEYIRRCIIEILDINDKFTLENYYEDLFKNIEVQWENKM